MRYYPEAGSEVATLPVASRSQKSAMFAMCVLIPLVTGDLQPLFQRKAQACDCTDHSAVRDSASPDFSPKYGKKPLFMG